MAIECSVIILTYNTKLSEILITLESIIQQSMCDYEIIIADDGSEIKYIDEIKAFFKEKQFSRYQLIENPRNNGTVKNLYSGLMNAKGRYIKVLGAGDLLFSKKTLENLCLFMKQHDVVMAFGLLCGYYKEKGTIRYKTINVPGDILSYRRKDEKKIKENLIVFGKCISGASMFFKREELTKLISEIKEIVVYCEDWIQVLLVLNNDSIGLIDEYVVWYECNMGISNSKNTKMIDKMRKDHDCFYDYIEKKYSNNPYIIRSNKKRKLNSISNNFLRGAIKFIIEPRTFLISYETRKQSKKGMYSYEEKDGFLKDLKFLKHFNELK